MTFAKYLCLIVLLASPVAGQECSDGQCAVPHLAPQAEYPSNLSRVRPLRSIVEIQPLRVTGQAVVHSVQAAAKPVLRWVSQPMTVMSSGRCYQVRSVPAVGDDGWCRVVNQSHCTNFSTGYRPLRFFRRGFR